MSNRRPSHGFTLIELIIYIVVVSVGLLGILAVFSSAVKGSADPLIRKQVLSVAEATLEEILLKRFDDPDGDCTPLTTPRCQANSTTDRINYNDVSDYNGWDQTGVRSPDTPLILVPGLENYRVQVAVSATTLNGVAMKEIVVSVSGGGEQFALTGHKANYD